MQRGELILVVAAVLAIAGCQREFANRNLEQVKPNMSQKEVESILGNPDRTEKVDLELQTEKKTMAITRYYYNQKGETVVLHFQNGHLINAPEKLKEK
jgi:outer membrane lipopolysaccharide assembly protein LptE/RlpB